MPDVFTKIQRSILYIVITLIAAFMITSFVMVSQQWNINANKERNAQFHLPSMLRAADA